MLHHDPGAGDLHQCAYNHAHHISPPAYDPLDNVALDHPVDTASGDASDWLGAREAEGRGAFSVSDMTRRAG